MDDLVARFVAGDPDAISAIVQEYGGAIRTVARSMVSEPDLVSDVVQQTFIKAWKASASFDGSRELAPWLYAIARRTAIDVLRTQRRPAPVELRDTEPAPPSLSFERTWERFEVRRALDRLPDEEREVVRLSHLVGLSHPAIAEQLGVPVGTVKSRSHRAMKRLATMLGHLDDSEIQTAGGHVQDGEEPT